MNNIDINPEILNKINLIFKNVFNEVFDLDYRVDKYLLTKIEEKRNKIIKFEGCYHGHSDSLLVKAGSGLLTDGITDSNGLTKGTTDDTITLEYNNIEMFEEYLNKNEVAAVIVEPVAANMGLVLPKENFLRTLKELTEKTGALLIFDEVITGFRLGASGANGYFGIKPDLLCFGKIIGGGMPLGAFAGKREHMKEIAPSGTVYHAGTMSGNPICVRAGITSLGKLNDELYKNCWPGEAESGSVSPGWVVRQESNWYPIQGCVLI